MLLVVLFSVTWCVDLSVCVCDRNVRRCMEHNRQKTLRHRRHDDDDPSAAAAAAAGGGSDNDNNDNNDDENDVRRDDGGRGGMSLLDDVECKFNVNSYRMVFVINTESFLYRRNSLTTARQVSLV